MIADFKLDVLFKEMLNDLYVNTPADPIDAMIAFLNAKKAARGDDVAATTPTVAPRTGAAAVPTRAPVSLSTTSGGDNGDDDGDDEGEGLESLDVIAPLSPAPSPLTKTDDDEQFQVPPGYRNRFVSCLLH